MSSSPFVIDVTDATFHREVLERSRHVPVVVDLWAPWCGPCRVLGPILERLADQGGGSWILAKIDTDQNPQVAQALRVSGIPAVKAFRNGAIIDEFTGALPEPAVKRWLEGLLPSAADELFEQAAAAHGAGDLARAEVLLTQTLAQDPHHPRALVGLARLALGAGDRDKTRELLNRVPIDRRDEVAQPMAALELALDVPEGSSTDALRQRIEADPGDLEARHELAMLLLAASDYEPALEQLLEIVKRDRSFKDDVGRTTMIRIFEIVGVQSELAFTWRRRLGSVMYV